MAWIFGLKALGLRSRMPSTAACRVVSCSWLLQQLTQLQLSQYRPDAKHSQYLHTTDQLRGAGIPSQELPEAFQDLPRHQYLKT